MIYNIKIRFSSRLILLATLIFTFFLQNSVLCQTTDTFTTSSPRTAPFSDVWGTDKQNAYISLTTNNLYGTNVEQTLSVISGKAPEHSNYTCSSCHITHNAPGLTLTSVAGNAALCQSCHVSGGAASTMPFVSEDKAIPGTKGTFHAWDVLAINATYETNTPTDSEMAARITSNNIVCSVCHDQHSDTYTPYLRISNLGDAMCKDCHSARDVGLYSTDNTNHKGSHPVGVNYDGADSRFNASPTNTQVVDGNVECSSCHYVHDVDGSIGETTPKGYLLRNANDNTLCTDCHTYGTHNAMNCLDCHQTHNTNKSNIYMIKNTISTPSSGDKTVVFTAETGTNSHSDGDAIFDGVCEVCHTTASYHTNTDDGTTHNDEANCTTCHAHSDNFPGCTTCHTANTNFYTDVHDVHVSTYSYECNTCHFSHGSGTATHDDATSDVTFDPDGLAKNGGIATPTWNSGAATCDNIYCHSDAASTPTYTTTPDWNSGTISDCISCHLVDISSSVSPGTAAHTTHLGTPYNYSCSTCHNGLDNTSSGHADGTKDVVFDPTGLAKNGGAVDPIWNSGASTCDNIYCHSNAATPTYTTTPSWSAGSISDCISCHLVDISSSVSPGTAAHTAHLDAQYNYLCSTCHNGLDNTSSGHTDGTKDVVFDPTGLAKNGGAADPIWNSGASTCDNIYCHSDAATPTYTTAPDWTSATITTCTPCHVVDASTTAPSTAAHDTHTGTPYNYACSSCHFGLDGTHTIHADGTKDVVYNPSGLATRNGQDASLPGYVAPAFDGGTKACTNVYCHSNGITAQLASTVDYVLGSSITDYATYKAYYSPNWNTPADGACGTCHGGNLDATAWPDSRENNKDHGRPAHQLVCSWCHSADGTQDNILGTYNTILHVDGDVYFDARTFDNGEGTFSITPSNSNAVDEDGHCGIERITWY